MKKYIPLLLMITLPLFTSANHKDFSYDTKALQDDFSELNKIADYVNKTNISYQELSKTPVFEGNLLLTNTISVKPNLKFDDLDWGSFVWGFCCWPVGIFTVIINDDKDKNSKDSYWAGLASSVIVGTLAYVGIYVYAITAFSTF